MRWPQAMAAGGGVRDSGERQHRAGFAMFCQADAELLASGDEPSADGRLAAVQGLSGFDLRHPFQLTKHDRQAVSFGKSSDCLVKLGELAVIAGRHFDRVEIDPGSLPSPPFLRFDAQLDRQAMRHPVEPAGERLIDPERSGSSEEDQERRLKRILGIDRVAEDIAADRPDQRPVPRHEHGERFFVMLIDEPAEQ
jgi:hypothetical protein